jgi:hypothetical protein
MAWSSADCKIGFVRQFHVGGLLARRFENRVDEWRFLDWPGGRRW